MDRAVEVTHTADGITLLFDTFSGESKNLLESFKNAGAAFHAAVIEDDGFLPDDVMSVYGFFLGDYRKADSLPGKPLYFNQIQISQNSLYRRNLICQRSSRQTSHPLE